MRLIDTALLVLAVACAAGAGALIGRMMSVREAGQEIPGRTRAVVALVAVAAAGIALLVIGR